MSLARPEAHTRLAAGGLYLLTPPSVDGAWIDRCLVPVLAVRPGILQLRITDNAEAATYAPRLRALTRSAGTLLIVNDDVELAAACDADGVHLGREDLPIAMARARLGPEVLIGASCYGDVGRAAACSAAGADYLAFGAIFASPTKPGAPVIGTSILAQARERFALPLVAIGGIAGAGASACRRAGADWVAVVDAVWGSPDPVAAVQALMAALAACPARAAGTPAT